MLLPDVKNRVRSILPLALALCWTAPLCGETPAEGLHLELPAHPRLMLADAEIPKIRARIAQSPTLAARYRELLRAADRHVAKKVELPPRGGQWPHWYVCKKDGGNLKAVSPTQHKCTICGEIYSGWPYDDVPLMDVHNRYGNAIRDLGLAYRLSGEKKYADKAREILLAYADKYMRYPLHDKNGKNRTGGGHVGPQTLDEAVWLISVCQGADLIWDRLTPSEQSQIETGLLRPGAETIRRHKMGIHNIQCWKNSAVGLVGLLLGDPELVADAVTSGHGIQQQIAQGINDDGQWYEGAWGYHFYATGAMAPLVEAGERCGLRLYAYQADGKSYRNLFEGPLNLAMPDMTLPAFNDSGQVGLAGTQGLYELALAHYGNPRFADVLRLGKRDSIESLLFGVAPLPPAADGTSASHNYPSGGYAVLQQGQGSDATWLCLKYGPHGGGHGHPDKLNFILYSRRKVLAFDPGTGKYGAPIHADWQRTTIAHNTLTVDESNQKPATGRCLAFLSRRDAAAALAEAGPIYDGVTYRRAVALLGARVVVVLDLVSAAHEHTFDLAYHHAGAWTAAPQGTPLTMPEKPGYAYLKDMVRSDGPLPQIVQDPLRSGLAVAATPNSEVWVGTGAGTVSSTRVPCVIVRTRGKRAVVAWAIDLDGSAPTVRITATDPAWTVVAAAHGTPYRFTVAPDAAEKLKVE